MIYVWDTKDHLYLTIFTERNLLILNLNTDKPIAKMDMSNKLRFGIVA